MIATLLGFCLAAPLPAVDLDQVDTLMEQGHFQAAETLLSQELRTEEGRIDPTFWLALVDVRIARTDRPGAREAAEQALTWSRSPDQAERAEDHLSWLADGFGTVALSGEAQGLNARVLLTHEGTDKDALAARWVAALTEELAGGLVLGRSVDLPVGDYQIDGHAVTVRANERSEVRVSVPNAALQRTEIQVSPGFGGWIDAPVVPAPSLELGLVVPQGVAVFGLRAGAASQVVDVGAGNLGFRGAPTVGLEAGLGTQAEHRLRLRGGLSVRATQRSASVFPVGTERLAVVAPGLWTSMGVFQRRGPTGFGMALRVAGDRGLEVVLPAGEGPGIAGGWAVRSAVDLTWEL